MQYVGIELLSSVGREIADFCEERKNCFDLDFPDLVGLGLVGLGVDDENGMKQRNGNEYSTSDIFDTENGSGSDSGYLSLTRARNIHDALFGTIMSSTSTSASIDETWNIGEASVLKSEEEKEEEEDNGFKLCLHDDDINSSEKTITALIAIGITNIEAESIRRKTEKSGSCVFQPNHDSAYLPTSVTSKDGTTTFMLTEKMKRYMPEMVKNSLIFKKSVESLRGAGLKISIVNKLIIAREGRVKNILSWLTDLSQINDGMVRD